MEYDIVVNLSGIKYFYKKGTNILHREDGPAVEFCSGSKMWYFNGKPHRINGPAIEWANGDKEWWVDGKHLSKEKEIILNRWWDNKNGI